MFISNLVIFLTLVLPVLSVDEKSIREMKCSQVSQKLNREWYNSVNIWYPVMWSKLEKLRTVSAVLNQTAEEVQDEHLSDHSCAVVDGAGTITMFGTKGAMVSVDTENGFSFTINGVPGECTVRLTDNASYMLLTTCWGGDEASWVVLSTNKKISKDAKIRILHLIQALGFDAKKALIESFDKCKSP